MLGHEFVSAVVVFHHQVGKLLGVSAVERKALDALDQLGPSTNGHIASHTGLTTGAVTVLVDRLEARGLVRRTPHPTDGRKTIVALTDHPQRKQVTDRVFGALRADMSHLMSAYTSDQLATIADFQRRCTDLLAQHTHIIASERKA